MRWRVLIVALLTALTVLFQPHSHGQVIVLHGGGGQYNPPPYFYQNAGPNMAPSKSGTLTGSNNCFTVRLPQWTGAAAISDLKLGFVNAWLGNTNNGEQTSGLGNATIGVYVEYSGLSGGNQQMTWNGGGTSGSSSQAPNVSIFFTDDVTLSAQIPANTKYYDRITWCSSNKVLPFFAWDNVTTMIADTGTVQFNGSIGSGSDQENGTGALTGASSAAPWIAPILSLSQAVGGSGSCIISDSGGMGHGDTLTTDVINDRGIGPRELYNSGNPIPWTLLANDNATAKVFGFSGFEGQALKYCRNTLIERGNNDLSPSVGNETASQTIAAMQALSNLAISYNGRVFVRQIVPHTTSTDNWATLENQAAVTPFCSGCAGATVRTAITNGAGNTAGPNNVRNYAVENIISDNGTNAGISGASAIISSAATGYPNSWLWASDASGGGTGTSQLITCEGIHPCGGGNGGSISNGYTTSAANAAATLLTDLQP